MRFIALTLYIALINSYALFIIYPALKDHNVMSAIIGLVVYVLLTLPLLIYIKTRFQPRPRKRVLIIGIAVMVAVTILQYVMSHISLPTLFIHLLFYLFAGIVEETLWRGKLWQLVSQKVSSEWAVLAVVTLHFVALHIPFAFLEKPTPLFFLGQVVGLGIVLGILRLVTKKVTIPAFAHAVINMVVYT
jgi:membrane protease YdiL (CAAX protease family)